jgi:hypothetical protein
LSPDFAVMVAVPTLWAVTTPSLTLATDPSVLDQVTVLSVASSGFTVAVRVTVSPAFKVALGLLSVTLVTGVGTTVTAHVALLSPDFAVIVAVPTLCAVTTPALTLATDPSVLDQVTVLSVASSGFTVAVRVTVSPTFKEAFGLSNETDSTLIKDGITFTVHRAIFPSASAVIIAVPAAKAFSNPSFTVTTDGSELVQTIDLSVAFSGLMVTFIVLLSPVFISRDVSLKEMEETGMVLGSCLQEIIDRRNTHKTDWSILPDKE